MESFSCETATKGEIVVVQTVVVKVFRFVEIQVHEA